MFQVTAKFHIYSSLSGKILGHLTLLYPHSPSFLIKDKEECRIATASENMGLYYLQERC